jgi:SRSO17 transposase
MEAADAGRAVDLTTAGPAIVALRPEDLADLGAELAAYHAHFAPFFARREQRAWAQVYLRGLLTADVARKNGEAMALRLLGVGPHAAHQVRALQQFIGEGAWDDAAILAEHQRLVAASLGEKDGVLILDGSDIPKRGSHSAGAAPQWCGALGKIALCQAGVFLRSASRKGYTLLDRRLFVPEPWFDADHAPLWRACRIPADVVFQTTAELGAQMVEQVPARGELPASWLVCDEGFGRHQALLERVDAAGLWYLAEVPRTTPVWPLREPTDGRRVRARPRAWLPPRAPSGKGRLGTQERLHPDSPPALPVESLADPLARRRWRRYRLLEGRQGPIVADFVARRALASRSGAREGIPGPEVWVLIRRPLPLPGQTTPPPELKYYLSTAPADLPLAELMRVCGMRWPIECCFEEGKGELGMDHDELRFWRGWQHHMTLVILAQHVLVRLRQRLMERSDRDRTAATTGARAASHVMEPPAGESGGERGRAGGSHSRQQLRRCQTACPGPRWRACRSVSRTCAACSKRRSPSPCSLCPPSWRCWPTGTSARWPPTVPTANASWHTSTASRDRVNAVKVSLSYEVAMQEAHIEYYKDGNVKGRGLIVVGTNGEVLGVV